ncbi:ATP-binding cassette domain-containing protein [Lacticaseibacillus mingshuiensis]|uniref:ATP-binding cassette domain-containing protein n=1 Tax=Lacticaseibacillus mingshuiensis TaxID=2799574 RepID=A0ABW4CIX3_9LACO|nr:ABC transporter ATP-binding protein [Lacticaseibacillus mingshuiensis]
MKKYILQFWKQNLFLILLIVVSTLSQTINVVLAANALTALVKFDLRGFVQWYLVSIALWGLYLVLTYLQIVYQERLIQTTATAIRSDLGEAISKLNYAGFHQNNNQNYAAWMTNDIGLIENTGLYNLYSLVQVFFAALFSAIALISYHYTLVLTAFVFAAIIIYVPNLLTKAVAEKTANVSNQNSALLTTITDVVNAFDTLFSANRLPLIHSRITTASRVYGDSKVAVAKAQGRVAVLAGAVNVIAQLGIAIETGVLIAMKWLPIGAISATGGLASTIFNSLGTFSNSWVTVRSIQPIFDKFQTLIDLADDQAQEDGVKNQQPTPGTLKLAHINYWYGEREVLRDLSVNFNLNGKYALVGPSGSGKSTLLEILDGRLTPAKGEYTIGESRVSALSSKALHDMLIYIDQTPHLFNDTLRFNLTLGRSVEQAELDRVLSQVGLDELLKKLPDGLETVLDTDGTDLSGGERQRIALARGTFAKVQIMLLDESTSALDKQSNAAIEKVLLELPNTTVILVTHHLTDELAGHLDQVFDIEHLNGPLPELDVPLHFSVMPAPSI